MRRRVATGVSVLGLVLVAAGLALGVGAIHAHLAARRAWLDASDVSAAGYDANASDALYDAVIPSLDQTVLLARTTGLGLVLLAAGLAFRVPRRRTRAAVVLGLVATALTWALLAFAAARFSHPLAGPIVTQALAAFAPFAAAAAGISVWALRARRSAAKVPASGDTR